MGVAVVHPLNNRSTWFIISGDLSSSATFFSSPSASLAPGVPSGATVRRDNVDHEDDEDHHFSLFAYLDRRLVDEVTRILESTFAQRASGSVSVSGDLKNKDFKDGRHFEGFTTTTEQDHHDHQNQENFEASFPDRPLQLVCPDAQHKGLVLEEENLRLLHAIRQPVYTVAIIGKYHHSGKSFLLNQIIAFTD
ncbi:Guanylate-binding protein, N-terminal domain [Tyrophagus putrescentiae]|nr:Guanylate-binding protein, N-terminal domain [Tyrophagus putrescentiae]